MPLTIEDLNYDELEHQRVLYAEFAEEDRYLAEEGIEEYAHGLFAEDTNFAPLSS